MIGVFKHRSSNKEIVGRQLVVGDTVEPDDVYQNSGGEWMPASSTNCVGITIREGYVGVTWVRPS